jgi:hypothetical protein
MIDWMTATIEAIGIIILVVWTIIPIQEFRLIAKRLRAQRRTGEQDGSGEERR